MDFFGDNDSAAAWAVLALFVIAVVVCAAVTR